MGVEKLFRDASSVVTLAPTGVLVSPQAFEYIMELAFSDSAPEPTVELSSTFVGGLSRVLSLAFKQCCAKEYLSI